MIIDWRDIGMVITLVAAIAWGRSEHASRVEAEVEAARMAAEAARSAQASKVCTHALSGADAALTACSASSDARVGAAIDIERSACSDLVRAAEAKARLDVDRSDVHAVVEALRKRRRGRR